MSDLAQLLDAVAALIRRYVVCSLAQVRALTLFVAHTYALDASDVTPYINIKSAEPESGKTRLLEVLERLVRNPWQVVDTTVAALFRKIATQAPTLLLDETDAIFSGSTKNPVAEGLRGILNAGYRRGASVPRCTGKNFETLVDFPVFCPKVLAGLRDLPATISGRSVKIVLVRRKKGELVVRFKYRQAELEAGPLREALAAWANIATDVLRGAEPAELDMLGDREAEIWEPLLAIADLAGGDWPKRARAAAVELHRGAAPVESVSIQLLRAIKDVFDDRGTERLFTADLLRALVEREADPWPIWWGKDVANAPEGEAPKGVSGKLAQILRHFEVKPGPVRDGVKVGRGYKREDFTDAFERYLGPGTTDVTIDATLQAGSPIVSNPLGGNGCNDGNGCNVPQGRDDGGAAISGLDDDALHPPGFCWECGASHEGACP